MKQYAIRRLYSYFELTTEEIDSCAHDEKLEALDAELRAVIEKYGLKVLGHDGRFIPQKKMSATECENCGNLMINRDKNPARFNREELWADLDTDYNSFVWDGGTHEGRELCMECLPVEHRWGYFS